MAKMWRVTTEGVVSQCDDTSDEDKSCMKYQKSAMRPRMWIWIFWEEDGGWMRTYTYEEHVPKLVKMMDLLDP